jgi:hypothetical protein
MAFEVASHQSDNKNQLAAYSHVFKMTEVLLGAVGNGC